MVPCLETEPTSQIMGESIGQRQEAIGEVRVDDPRVGGHLVGRPPGSWVPGQVADQATKVFALGESSRGPIGLS